MAACKLLFLTLAAVVLVQCASASICRLTCTSISTASKNTAQTTCTSNGGTFTEVSATVIQCSGSASCSDQNAINSCNSVPAALNGDGTGTSGCTNTIICDDSGSSAKCFPANATVSLADGTVKAMKDLAVGDKVLSKGGEYQEVYMFSHKLAAVQGEFVRITTRAGRTIRLTENHYLYVNSKLATAATVRVGDMLTSGAANGEQDAVVAVARSVESGLYNPHTMDGDIVVDGILTSIYTSDIQPTLAHYILWPVRMLHKLGHSVVGDAFASGSDLIASLLPNGKATY